ncbi:hypothetical protein [Tatumella sp. UBA2305]|uniref:hypothetical protein n=1 Tax=Tatumella sp. UBA2305 TaxID=1947647 RepID=UPI0025ED811E|nr:hypothetical protein [Tatumella sp. UBA2305]
MNWLWLSILIWQELSIEICFLIGNFMNFPPIDQQISAMSCIENSSLSRRSYDLVYFRQWIPSGVPMLSSGLVGFVTCYGQSLNKINILRRGMVIIVSCLTKKIKNNHSAIIKNYEFHNDKKTIASVGVVGV